MSIRRLRLGDVQSAARGASLSSGDASQRVGRGGGGLAWLVYGGRGLHGRWHAVLWANVGELVLGVGFSAAGAGVGTGLTRRRAARVGRAPRACSGVARARRTRGRVHLHEFLRLQSSQTCESCHMSCVRFLPGT
jgi:hypothetical protein